MINNQIKPDRRLPYRLVIKQSTGIPANHWKSLITSSPICTEFFRMNLDGIEHQNGALSSRSQKGAEMSASEEEAIHVHLIRQERERATFSGDKNHSFGTSLSWSTIYLSATKATSALFSSKISLSKLYYSLRPKKQNHTRNFRIT